MFVRVGVIVKAFTGKCGSVSWCNSRLGCVHVSICAACVYVCVRLEVSCTGWVAHYLDAKRKVNQGAERNQPQGGAQSRHKWMMARIKTETASRKGQQHIHKQSEDQ